MFESNDLTKPLVNTAQHHVSSTGEIHKKDGIMTHIKRDHLSQSNIDVLGYYGNIWVRSHCLLKAGDFAPGHLHHFDHVSLLTQGSVKVEIEGKDPKDFVAPTFIVIDRNLKHKITALEDNTIYFCVFALRDVDGDVSEIYSGDNVPYATRKEDEESLQDKLMNLRKTTVIESSDNGII